MQISGKKFVLIGGAGLIGSHTVDYLLRHDVRQVVVFDNFSRAQRNIECASGPEVSIRKVETFCTVTFSARPERRGGVSLRPCGFTVKFQRSA